LEKEAVHSLTPKSTLSKTAESFVKEITMFNAVKYTMSTKDEVIVEYYTNYRAVSAMLLLRGISIEEGIAKRIR